MSAFLPSASPCANAPGAVRRLLLARACRDFADGFLVVLLPLHLLALNFSATAVGVLAAVALAGSAAMTIAIGRLAGRFAGRSLLLAAAMLMAATGLALASTDSFALLLLVAFLGTVNPSGSSASAFTPIEHTMLTGFVADDMRTHAFARYSLAGALAGACGGLAAATPDVMSRIGMTQSTAFRAMFLVYAALGACAVMIYRSMPVDASRKPAAGASKLGPSRGIVTRLAALFSLDAFAGGFVVQSLLALWLFERFDLSLATAGLFFFWSGLLSAFSFPVASWLAARIGLVNTMVYTHIPSSLCLIGSAFAPRVEIALALLLARAALSQMDVPTRSSYVMAVVTEPERPAAASFTAVPRSLAAAASPAIAGALYGMSGGATPLVICGVLKILYDLLLLWQFRHLRPPEELK